MPNQIPNDTRKEGNSRQVSGTSEASKTHSMLYQEFQDGTSVCRFVLAGLLQVPATRPRVGIGDYAPARPLGHIFGYWIAGKPCPINPVSKTDLECEVISGGPSTPHRDLRCYFKQLRPRSMENPLRSYTNSLIS